MASPSGLSRHNHFSEFNSPLVTNQGVLSPSDRRGLAIANLFGENPPDLGVTLPDDLTVEGDTIAEGNLTVEGDFVAEAGFTLGATAVTATAEEINAAADGSANTVAVAAGGAAVTPLAGGGTYLIPLVTANVTMTLPATPTLGEKHKLVFIGTAADAEDWVITAAAFFKGGVAFFDVGGTNAAVYGNGSTENTLTVNNPAAGTEITFIGDGTNWTVTGMVSSADAPAFTAV